MSKKTVQVLLADGVEEMEAIAPVDLLRRAGVTVITLSLHDRKEITGRNQISLIADALFKEHKSNPVDMIIIPGGPSHLAMMDDPEVIEWIQSQDKRNGWIASICAGPKVLEKAGVLEGKSFTSHFTAADSLPKRVADQPVITDQKLITSQGAGTATEFALALVEALCGKDQRQATKEEISNFS